MTHTLDPDDWTSFRSLAHEMVDDMLDHLSTIGERPAWRPMPDEIRSSFNEAPQKGEGADAALVAGVEEADSIGFDLHKWMYLPFDVACSLVRDPALHRATFAHAPSYLAETTRGVIAGGLPFADRGLDLTRNFRALKIWMTLKAYGVQTFARAIEENVRQARHLAARVEASEQLELLAPAPLNIVCFRYTGPEESRLNAINEEILLRIQERGIAVPSGTVLDGRYAIRVAITNHRSRIEDFDALVDAVVAIGGEVAL